MRRSTPVLVLLWLGLVAAGSGLVWATISSVGRQVSSGPSLTAESSPPVTKRVDPPPFEVRPVVVLAPKAAPEPSTQTPPVDLSDQPDPVSGEWQDFHVGFFRATCFGPLAVRGEVGAWPGYQLQMGDRAGPSVQVGYVGQDVLSWQAHRVEVRARCVGGRPEFSASYDGEVRPNA